EFFADKSKEPTLNDSILVEDNDSNEEIEEQENLAQKRKIN
ncbi:28089_t:CDS:2, partial [Gigaspora margarita]